MAVDNGTVQRIIQKALDANNYTGDVSSRLNNAWSAVNYQREAPGGVNCGNGNLAAADHYLFMRWAGSVVGPAGFAFLQILVQGYDGLLKAGQAVYDYIFGGSIVFQTGQCQATGFSLLVLLWAQQGVRDGVTDYCFTENDDMLTAPSNPYPLIP